MVVSVPHNESTDQSRGDLEVLNEILAALNRVEGPSQERILNTVATFLGLNTRPIDAGIVGATNHSPSTASKVTLFSEDRSVGPKQFMFEKQPKTDVEKVACLAYYLTHYRDTDHFKTLDISKLNTEAAQVKFANAAMAVDNATKRGYLALATKGTKQLSALGEQYVLALPDRERARNIMENARPRRRTKKASQQRPHLNE